MRDARSMDAGLKPGAGTCAPCIEAVKPCLRRAPREQAPGLVSTEPAKAGFLAVTSGTHVAALVAGLKPGAGTCAPCIEAVKPCLRRAPREQAPGLVSPEPAKAGLPLSSSGTHVPAPGFNPAAWGLLLLAACGGGEVDAVPAAGVAGAAGASAVLARGPYGEPPVAADLDPSPEVVRVALRAERVHHHVGEYSIDGYGFNGLAPGPTIRAKQGDTLVVELDNDLDTATTIHWHGLSVPNDMDGVPWKLQPVAPGGRFVYSFVLKQPGTFWYHPHVDEHQQVDLGLYGALIVEEREGPRADVDLVLVLDAWGEMGSALQAGHDGGSHGGGHDDGAHGGGGHEASGGAAGASPDPHGHHGTGALPTLWSVNGEVSPVLALPGGKTVRARLINASVASYLSLLWPDIRQVGADQGLWSSPRSPGRILLGPGDRAEVEWAIGADGFEVLNEPHSLAGAIEHGAPSRLFRVAVPAPAAAPAPVAWPSQSAPPTPDPGSTDIVYVFTGSDGSWRINGEAFPDVTIEELQVGRPSVIEVRNLSGSEHPFHLHGSPFEVLSVDDVPPPQRLIEDTINVGVQQRVRLRVVFEHEGEWMVHCHIARHMHEGMMTVVRVTP